MSRFPVLVTVAVVSATCLAVVYWPSTERIPGERMSAAQILAQSNTEVVAKVTSRLSQRAGSSLSGWRRLPEACRPVYVVGAFIVACDKYSLADQAHTNAAFPDAPTFVDMADALRAVGSVAVATVLDEAAKAPPDSLAECETRLRAAMAAAHPEDALRVYIRSHAVELADP
mgnify:CR=1 FL=1